MSIIHTHLTSVEVNRLRQRDHDYLKRKLDENCLLSRIMNKKVNRLLLKELQCILDGEPLPRRKAVQYERQSKVRVFNSAGKLVRIEHSNGRVAQLCL